MSEKVPMIAFDQAEDGEWAGCCEFLAQRLTAADPAVTASLNVPIGTPDAWFELRDEPVRFSRPLLFKKPRP